MDVKELGIEGAWAVTPRIHEDSRGAFLEWFRADRFEEAAGHRFDLQQANCSVSSAGTVRGIHFAELPPSQAKYVTCLAGAALDVVVDVRVGSPTFGRWEAVELDDVTRRAVYLSEGLGHAFMALVDGTVIAYLCSATYDPEREHGVHPLDPEIGIAWPRVGHAGVALEPVLSGKDAGAPSLEDARLAGVLPSYEECVGFRRALRGLPDD